MLKLEVKKVLLLLSLSTLFNSIVTLAGVRDGAGGDGIFEDGEITLRDFITEERPTLVTDNVIFLKNTKGFEQLINEISSIQPDLALKILEQLISATIWTTDKSLPILPHGATTLIGKKTDVQMALRFNQDIIFHRPSLKSKNAYYILVHEALHGIVPGSGPIHQMYVENILNYFKNNRGSLSTKELNQLLGQSRVSYKTTPRQNSLLRTLLVGDFSEPLTCAAYSMAKKNSSYNWIFFGHKIDTFYNWRNFNLCDKNAAHNYLNHEFKEIYNYFQLDRYTSEVPYIYNIVYKPSWYHSTEKKEWFKSYCLEYASSTIEEELRVATEKINTKREIIEATRNFLKQNQLNEKNARDSFLSTLISYDGYLTSSTVNKRQYFNSLADINDIDEEINKKESDLQQAWDTYSKNIDICQK